MAGKDETENESPFWGSLAIGIIVGGKLQHPSSSSPNPSASNTPTLPSTGHESNGGAGGSKGFRKEHEYHGLFPLFGHETWFYVGGVGGVGKKFGIYGTTGPMIGRDFDWAIGGGIHFFRTIGIGVVIPIRQALMAASGHSEKVSYLLDKSQYYISQATHAIAQTCSCSLEKIASDPSCMALAGVGVIGSLSLAGKDFSAKKTFEGAKKIYSKAKNYIIKNLYGL